MTDLCAIADVEALAGYSIVPAADQTRASRLIELASAVVAEATVTLPAITPDVVTLVTATLVVRQLANPTGAHNETIGAYQVGYGPVGMQLTDADENLLGDWLGAPPGRRAYSVQTFSPFAVDDTLGGFWDFSSDDIYVNPYVEPIVEEVTEDVSP